MDYLYFTDIFCEEIQPYGYDYFDNPNEDYVPVRNNYDPNRKYKLIYWSDDPLPRNEDFFRKLINNCKEEIITLHNKIYDYNTRKNEIVHSKKRNKTKTNLIKDLDENIYWATNNISALEGDIKRIHLFINKYIKYYDEETGEIFC